MLTWPLGIVIAVSVISILIKKKKKQPPRTEWSKDSQGGQLEASHESTTCNMKMQIVKLIVNNPFSVS